MPLAMYLHMGMQGVMTGVTNVTRDVPRLDGNIVVDVCLRRLLLLMFGATTRGCMYGAPSVGAGVECFCEVSAVVSAVDVLIPSGCNIAFGLTTAMVMWSGSV